MKNNRGQFMDQLKTADASAVPAMHFGGEQQRLPSFAELREVVESTERSFILAMEGAFTFLVIHPTSSLLKCIRVNTHDLVADFVKNGMRKKGHWMVALGKSGPWKLVFVAATPSMGFEHP